MGAANYQFKVGAFDCACISDGTFDYPAAAFVANAPSERFQAELQQRNEPSDHVTSPYTCLVVDTGQHKVLVDTGAGFAPSNGHLRENLQAAGIALADIDTVILTHGHADHIGGNLDAEGKAAFPNARYVMAEAEWNFWTRDPDLGPMPMDAHLKGLLIEMARRNLPPLGKQVDLIAGETEIVPGIYAIPAPGHTPGHIAILISSGDTQLLHIADTVLHPVLMEHADWISRFDLSSDQTKDTKRRILDRAAAEKPLVLAFHFAPFPGLGHIAQNGDAWQWQPVELAA